MPWSTLDLRVTCSTGMTLTVWYVGGGATAHEKYRSSTLVGLRPPDMGLQTSFRTGSIFDACHDLLQTGDAYSAEEEPRARAEVRTVLASVLH